MGGNESGIGIIRIDNETQLVLYSLKVGALIGLRHRQGLLSIRYLGISTGSHSLILRLNLSTLSKVLVQLVQYYRLSCAKR